MQKMMRRLYIILFMFAMSIASVNAQSMSDEQVIKFVMKEHKNGSSQAEIVSKLVQKGVNIDQINRVKKKYERLEKEQGLGTVKDKTLSDEEQIDSRLRRNNSQYNNSTEKLKDDKLRSQRNKQNNKNRRELQLEEEEEKRFMKTELDDMLPDSLDIYDRMVIKNYLRDKELLEKKHKRKVFGRDIFNNDELSFEPNMNIATPQNYVLGPGDAVFIDIYGASQRTIEATVTPDGFVAVEDFGPVQVAGMTVSQATAQLRSKLGSRYQSSKIRLSLGQTRTITVNVMGEVETPGTYTMSAFASVFHALYMAGGPNEIGTLRNIKVFRNNRLATTVDVYDYILNGKQSGNIRLSDNDVIVVGPYDCLVNMTGKVKRPMFYEMKKNESLLTLLKYSGGFTGDAYKKNVRVTRKAGTQYSIHTVNEFDMASFRMEDEDSVSVDSILPRYMNMVEVKGSVFRPGKYQLGDNINSVRTLIEHAEGVTEDAFTAHAVMHRMKPDRTLEVVAVDIDGILSGKTADIPLQNEDVLFVPTKQEVQVEQTVSIHGEVMYPGVYKYAANETLEDFVLQAGGLKETASMVNVFVSRRIVNPFATSSDSLIANTFNFSLKDGFVIDGESGFHLQPFDEVYVRKSPGYNEQQNVTIEGEVLFSGEYTLSKKDERLSDLVKKAGGVTNIAYVEGARLERKLNEAERMRYEESVKMQRQQNEATMMEQALKSGRSLGEIQAGMTAQQEKLQIPETYPVGIELDKALEHPGSDYDLVLREGDRLVVPVYTGTVKINGEVMYPNTVGFEADRSVKYYINQAGGYSSKAKKRQTYIIYMNGDVAKVGRKTKVRPGCEIVVPAKVQNKMSTTETVALGTGIASIATMIATVASLMK